VTRQTINTEASTTTPSESKTEIGKNQMAKLETVNETADHLFDALLCEQVDATWCEKQGFSSRLYRRVMEDGTKIAYVVLHASARGDFALNQAVFNFLSAALSAGEIAGCYIVVADRKGLKPVRQIAIGELAERLKNVSPMEGQYGDFWWVNEQLRPAGQRRLAAAL